MLHNNFTLQGRGCNSPEADSSNGLQSTFLCQKLQRRQGTC